MDKEGKKTGGRQKGTPNADTKDIRAMFKKIVEKNLEGLQDDIKKLKGIERVKYTLEMSKFCIPTLKSIDYKGDVVVEAKRKITFVDKSKNPQAPIIKIIVNDEDDFIPPSNEPIF